MEQRDLVIIGSGPAGYTAAIYAARAGLNVLVLQGIQPGGQLTITTEVENFPGFPQGILGPELMINFEAQAKKVGAIIRFALVTDLDVTQRPFVLTINETEKIAAKAVIIATGASAQWLNLESEQRLNGSGVSACAVCDGFFFRGKEVAVVGGGDTACEEALYLSKICAQVHILVRKIFFRASKIMQERIFKTSNIEVHFDTTIIEILGEKKVKGIRIFKNNHEEEMLLDAVFIAIGHKPNSEIFKNKIATDEQGYIIVKAGTTQTNVAGIFAAGDIQDRTYRQAITAAGSGCMAALDAEKYLTDLDN